MVLMILFKFGSSVRDYLKPKGWSKRKIWLNISRVILLSVRSLCIYDFVWNIVMKLRRVDFMQYICSLLDKINTELLVQARKKAEVTDL